MIKLPFSWSDWVDLTMLNSEIMKPIGLKIIVSGCKKKQINELDF